MILDIDDHENLQQEKKRQEKSFNELLAKLNGQLTLLTHMLTTLYFEYLLKMDIDYHYEEEVLKKMSSADADDSNRQTKIKVSQEKYFKSFLKGSSNSGNFKFGKPVIYNQDHIDERYSHY